MIFYLLWERAYVACVNQGSIKKKNKYNKYYLETKEQ